MSSYRVLFHQSSAQQFPTRLSSGSIRPSQLQPFSGVKVPRYGRFLKERIVNSLVVNRRRLWSTVRIIMAHDEVLSHRGDASGKPDLVGGDALKKIPVFHGSDCAGVIRRAIPENENRRHSFDRAQHRPIGLAGFGELATDDVVRLLGELVLWNRAFP